MFQVWTKGKQCFKFGPKGKQCFKFGSKESIVSSLDQRKAMFQVWIKESIINSSKMVIKIEIQTSLGCYTIGKILRINIKLINK